MPSELDDRKLASALLFLGGVQWFFIILIAEGLHPGYNSGLHYVSSLGVGSTALIYNSSVLLLGLTCVLGAYLIYRAMVSLIIILFWRFSSHRWLAGALSQFFLKLFIVAFILAGLGALAMHIAEEMETRARDRGALTRR